MIDLEKAVAVGNIILRSVEMLETALKTASTTLATGRAQLEGALAELETMRKKLNADRAKADTALDEKFKDKP